MRQAGILAAGALHALEHNRQRIAEDHIAARAIAEIIAAAKGAKCDAARVETNVVMIELDRASSEAVIEAAQRRGVLIGPLDTHRLRAVTHLDIPFERARQAAERLAEAIEAAERGAET